MIRKWIVTGAGLLWIALGLGSGASRLKAAPQAAHHSTSSGRTLNFTRIRNNQFIALWPPSYSSRGEF